MISCDVRSCDYCRRPIATGQRWVREKIYESPRPNQVPAYRHFHAEPCGEPNLSCWENYWMEREVARTAVPIENAGKVHAATLLADCRPKQFHSPAIKSGITIP
jgi:hypothetical protein